MNKLLHKLTLLSVKYIPILLAIVEFVAVILSYCGISTAILGVLLGTSLVTLIPMYIMSYTFKFCKYHRMVINYVTTNKIILLVDTIVTIPFGDAAFLLILLAIAGTFLALTIYNYMKYGDRSDT